MHSLQRWSALALGVAALSALYPTRPAHAAGVDGGVTFTDVVPSGVGINYRRAPSPRKAVRDAINNGPRILVADFPVVRAGRPQKERGAPGVALWDYDRDGDIDLYVTNGPGKANSLYRNELAQTGTLGFMDVAHIAGVTAINQDSTGVCYGDTDNDGDDDLYVVSVPSDFPNIKLLKNRFFVNNGNGTFSDKTPGSGQIAGVGRHASGCSMGDVNGDGLLDIYVANTYDDWKHSLPVFGINVEYYPGMEPDELFINKGKNVFTEQGAARGLQNFAGLGATATYTWAPALVDYDLDGDLDIQHADTQGGMTRVGAGYNRLWENDGTGHFTDVTILRGLTQPGSWMGLSYGDYNCDGHLDFFGTNLGRFMGGPTQNSRWFLGSASKSFSDPGVGSLVGDPFGWGTSTFDFDNDGDQDVVYMGDDDILQLIASDNPGTLLRNTGSCSAQFAWENVLKNGRDRQVHGVATGDVNNDGFDDIVSVAAFVVVPIRSLTWDLILGALPGTPFDAIARAELMFSVALPDGTRSDPLSFAYIPHTILDGDLYVEVNSANNGNNWAKVKLLGAKGLITGGRVNRSGIGAVIRSTPEGGPTTLRPVLGGASYASQNPLLQTLGLGDSDSASVEVLWPGGVRNVLSGILPGEQVLLPEVPCDYYRASWPSRSAFNTCLTRALNELRQRGHITSPEQQRLRESALATFDNS